MQVRFANEDRARGAQFRRHRGVRLGHAVGKHGASSRGSHAGGINIVLERDGDSMQWAAPLSRAKLRIQLHGLRPRLLFQHCDERIDLGIVDGDARKTRIGQFKGGDFTPGDSCRGLSQAERSQVHANVRRGNRKTDNSASRTHGVESGGCAGQGCKAPSTQSHISPCRILTAKNFGLVIYAQSAGTDLEPFLRHAR
jgi:hypothetical protein